MVLNSKKMYFNQNSNFGRAVSFEDLGKMFLEFTIILLIALLNLQYCQADTSVYYRAECSSNESIKKYGRITHCDVKVERQYFSNIHLQGQIFQPISPDNVNSNVHVAFCLLYYFLVDNMYFGKEW